MSCFYITDPAGSPNDSANWPKYGLLAWLIARHYQTFTINGYSGNMPAGFQAFDPCSGEYSRQIGNWIKKHGLTNVWSWNCTTGKWEKHSPDTR